MNDDNMNDDNTDDDMPRDLDDFRVRLARRVADYRQDWRRCQARQCRRMRRCAADAMPCAPAPVDGGGGCDDTASIADLRAAVNEAMALRGLAG